MANNMSQLRRLGPRLYHVPYCKIGVLTSKYLLSTLYTGARKCLRSSHPLLLCFCQSSSHSSLSHSRPFLTHIDQVADSCHITSYISEYLTYPFPPAPFPLPGSSTEADPGCDAYTEMIYVALTLNPTFSRYRIFDMVCRLMQIRRRSRTSH